MAVTSGFQRSRITGERWEAIGRSAQYLLAVFFLVIISVELAVREASTALKGLFGVAVILAWLRYPYFLLLSWVTISPLFGSTVPYIGHNNLDTALTIPTLIWLVRLPVRRTLTSIPGFGMLAVFVAWIFLGIAISPLGYVAFLKQWGLYVDQVAMVIMAISILSTRERISRFINVLLVIPLIVSVYGGYAYLTHRGLVDSTGTLRLISVYVSAPPVALFLSNLVPISVYRAAYGTSAERIYGAVAAVGLVIATVLTGTRGIIFTFPIEAVAVFLFLGGARRRTVFALAIATIGVLAFAANLTVIDRLSGASASSFNNRTALWSFLLNHFSPTAILGHGLGGGTYLITTAALAGGQAIGRVTSTGSNPQNLYIGVLFDHGIIGLVLLLATFAVLTLQCARGTLRTTGQHRILFLVALVTLLNVLVLGIESSDLFSQSIGLDFWLVIALPFAAAWNQDTPDKQPDPPARHEPVVRRPLATTRGPTSSVRRGVGF